MAQSWSLLNSEWGALSPARAHVRKWCRHFSCGRADVRQAIRKQLSTRRLKMCQPSSFQRCHLPRAFFTPTSCVCSADLPFYPDGGLPQSAHAQACLPSTSIAQISLSIWSGPSHQPHVRKPACSRPYRFLVLCSRILPRPLQCASLSCPLYPPPPERGLLAPKPGKVGASPGFCGFRDVFPSFTAWLEIFKKTSGKKITEGNHILGNIFLLPRLINTAPPLV